ncbi:MAG: four helix bundle protein [candidate division WOR-3 bacterium]
MRNVREYDVFNVSHKMTLEIYKLTKSFPKEEICGLVSQLRRSTYSIPMNLGEGGGRKGEKDFARFVSIALDSCEEVRYQLLLSKDLGYIDNKDYERIESEYERIKMMLSKLFSRVAESGGRIV